MSETTFACPAASANACRCEIPARTGIFNLWTAASISRLKRPRFCNLFGIKAPVGKPFLAACASSNSKTAFEAARRSRMDGPQGRKTLSARSIMARVVCERPAGPSMTRSSASAANLATRRIISSGSARVSSWIGRESSVIQADADCCGSASMKITVRFFAVRKTAR